MVSIAVFDEKMVDTWVISGLTWFSPGVIWRIHLKGCPYSFGLNVCKVHVQMGATEELGWASGYDLRWDLTFSGNEIKVKSSMFQIHLPFSQLFKYEGLKAAGLGCGIFGTCDHVYGRNSEKVSCDDLPRMDVKHIRLYPLYTSLECLGDFLAVCIDIGL